MSTVYDIINDSAKMSDVFIFFRNYLLLTISEECLQCFDAVGWAAGRASGL